MYTVPYTEQIIPVFLFRGSVKEKVHVFNEFHDIILELIDDTDLIKGVFNYSKYNSLKDYFSSPSDPRRSRSFAQELKNTDKYIVTTFSRPIKRFHGHKNTTGESFCILSLYKFLTEVHFFTVSFFTILPWFVFTSKKLIYYILIIILLLVEYKHKELTITYLLRNLIFVNKGYTYTCTMLALNSQNIFSKF